MAKTSIRKEKRARLQRSWSTPATKNRWLWLGIDVLAITIVLVWYLWQGHLNAWQGAERLAGYLAGLLFLFTFAYTLRRRFWKGLPGKLENWLWMHIGLGLLLFPAIWLHTQRLFLKNIDCWQVPCFLEAHGGRILLLTMSLALLSGIFVRFLDRWQSRIIVRDARSNGIGLVSSLEARLAEIDFAIERLCAGKSSDFVDFCWYALSEPHRMRPHPELNRSERTDFRSVLAQLNERSSVLGSIKLQKSAVKRMLRWRKIHTCITIIAGCLLVYHSLFMIIRHG